MILYHYEKGDRPITEGGFWFKKGGIKQDDVPSFLPNMEYVEGWDPNFVCCTDNVEDMLKYFPKEVDEQLGGVYNEYEYNGEIIIRSDSIGSYITADSRKVKLLRSMNYEQFSKLNRRENMKILIVVDPQVDFVSAGGALSVKGALDICNNINILLGQDKFVNKIITQDWHPENHESFASTHGTALFSMKQSFQGGKFINQMMWPNHCVAGTDGANVFDGILQEKADTIWRKGMHPGRECYSVFEYVNEGDGPAELTNHGLWAYTIGKQQVIKEVVICGVATDYCVKMTALGAKRLFEGAEITVVADAIAAVNPEHGYQALNDLRAAGITIGRTEHYV